MRPCLILIDEWVAYARQLYGEDGLPAGSFDAQFTFAQALTDAAREVSNALLLVSIPASDIETGGEGGRQARARLENVVGRMEAAWKPATADEGFEIVRRRLFEAVPPDLSVSATPRFEPSASSTERSVATFRATARRPTMSDA